MAPHVKLYGAPVSQANTKCYWWTNHAAWGDYALCEPCVANGVHPNREAQALGCAQQ